LRTRLTTVALAVLAALASAGPAGAATIHWHPPVRIEPAHNGGLSAVSCPLSRLCVAVDQSGVALVTTNPLGGPRAWHAFRIDSPANAPLTDISCPTVRLCVAVDAAGNVISSVRPTHGPRAWSRPVHVDPTTAPGGGPAGLLGIDCPSVALCVAVDGGTPGNAVSTTHPTGAATGWKLTAVGGVLTSIACPSSSLCVAAGNQHYVSTTPTGGAGSWHGTGMLLGGVFSDIACPSLTLCVAGGYANNSTGIAASSINPGGAASTWHTAAIEPNPPSPGTGLLDSIGCLVGPLCVATDSADNVFTSNWPGPWSTPTEIAPVSAATAEWSSIGCSLTLCVMVDSNGYAVTGTRHR
jgi:hypothetical protein